MFTPDDRIVYLSNTANGWDLFVTDTSGANVRQVSYDGQFRSTPTVCEKGASIYYSSDQEGTEHIWRTDLQSGASRRVTSGSGELSPKCASSDWVYYIEQVPGEGTHVFKMLPDGKNATRLSDRISISPPFVSLDGRWIAFAGPDKQGAIVATTISAEDGSVHAVVDVGNTRWIRMYGPARGCPTAAELRSLTFVPGYPICGRLQSSKKLQMSS